MWNGMEMPSPGTPGLIIRAQHTIFVHVPKPDCKEPAFTLPSTTCTAKYC